MTRLVDNLKEAIYSDLIPPVCIAEYFGMNSPDDRLNSLVMGVWQGAVKYHNELTLDQIQKALEQNAVKDLFHKATHRLAKRGHRYALWVLDRLDSVSFERPVPVCGRPYDEED